MPYPRKTLSTLKAEVAQDIASALPGSDALLRFANLKIMGVVQATLANDHYGYLDWIALQSNPFTATEEFLEAWAALKGVFRKPAVDAGSVTPGYVTFTANNGIVVPAGTNIARGDGITFTSAAAATASAGSVVVQVIADADPTGLTGVFGNTDVGVVMTLGQAIAGVQSTGAVTTAISGGTDIELDDDLRNRMLQAYQNPPQGGSSADYVGWALQFPGVTRAWCTPLGFGAGTVVVYIMLDDVDSVFDGFPQGTDGVATNESRGIPATGDQLLIANYIFLLRPVTALVYVVSPIAHPINFTISGVPTGSRAAVSAAIADVFERVGSPGGTVPLVQINTAIASVAGLADPILIAPTADITNSAGHLPTVGTITWS